MIVGGVWQSLHAIPPSSSYLSGPEAPAECRSPWFSRWKRHPSKVPWRHSRRGSSSRSVSETRVRIHAVAETLHENLDNTRIVPVTNDREAADVAVGLVRDGERQPSS